MIISIIVAADIKNGIGKENGLLCHLPGDLKYFKKITSGHCIVMGRKTYESIGRPLPNRTNIVISSNSHLTIEGCVVVHSLADAISYAKQHGETELMITGGGSIYEKALPLTHKVYLTRIQQIFTDADTFFKGFNESEFTLVKVQPNPPDEQNEFGFNCEVWERKS